MVHVGLTPERDLRTATVNRAELMEWTDTLGTLAPEKEADIVLLEGRPLDDISQRSTCVASSREASKHSTPEPPVPPLPW